MVDCLALFETKTLEAIDVLLANGVLRKVANRRTTDHSSLKGLPLEK